MSRRARRLVGTRPGALATDRSLRTFSRCRGGTAALEFALVAPLFFLFVFAILEMGLVAWFQTLVTQGADDATGYMRTQAMGAVPATMSGLRDAVCASVSKGGLSCDAAKLKLAVYDATEPANGSFGLPRIVDNTEMPGGGTAKEYVIAVGYDWGLVLPTSKMLLPQGPNGSQIQGFSFAVTAERVSE